MFAMRREARILKDKAICSIRRAARAFNSVDGDEGRETDVLLNLQHSLEMLVKAGLVQKNVSVFDKQMGVSFGFKRCVNLAKEHLHVSEAEAGTMHAIAAMRDEEQHWFALVSEGLLYTHTRAAVTLFDELLGRAFGETLAGHLPIRVLPISTEPPQDLQLLIDQEFSQVQKLLQPGVRKGAEAQARIRTMLALEAHVSEDPSPSSETDVARLERAVRRGGERRDLFPRLSTIGTTVTGDGINVTVHFSRAGEGAPVRLVNDESAEAAAVRQVDLSAKYHWSATTLATKLGLTPPRARALREHLGLEEDDSCRHEFKFGKSKHVRYSDNAHRRMRDALRTVDMGQVWREHKARQRDAHGPDAG